MDEILIDLLAHTDAAFSPFRREQWAARRFAVNASIRRWRYATDGVPCHTTAADELSRKEAQFARAKLDKAGLLVLIRSRSRVAGAALTSKGEERARALVGLPGVAAALKLAERVRSMMDDPAVCTAMGGDWLPETKLAGFEWGDEKGAEAFTRIEREALPALFRGWLDSGSDVYGRVYYRPLGKVPTSAAPSAKLPALSKELAEFYARRIGEVRAELQNASPRFENEIGIIPLPASMDGRETPQTPRPSRRPRIGGPPAPSRRRA